MTKISRNKLRVQRTKRIRAKISGTAEIPRLSVFRSLKGLQVQVINDAKGTTLVSAGLNEAKGKNTVEGAKKVGELVAKKCLEKKITQVAFDRSGYKYHGKVKAVADGAREGGLKF
ncbi:MAG TPA: 50S ribosomal protein L18 [Candidatus Moranbacteria bacterium]|nr:50S ribosomal protein L18 [Candidatus Moranbacteria bacterium]